nr:MAG TPA: hypothetical protein [Caudoviricetes sp.]
MPSTNKTNPYELSQFIGSDIPSWLSDYNGDMLKINNAIQEAKTSADDAMSSAGSASSDITALSNTVSELTENLNTTNQNVTKNTSDISSINSSVSNINQNVDSLNGKVNANTESISDINTQVTANTQSINTITPAFQNMGKWTATPLSLIEPFTGSLTMYYNTYLNLAIINGQVNIPDTYEVTANAFNLLSVTIPVAVGYSYTGGCMYASYTESGTSNQSGTSGFDINANNIYIRLNSKLKVGNSTSSGQSNRKLNFFTVIPLYNGLN